MPGKVETYLPSALPNAIAAQASFSGPSVFAIAPPNRRPLTASNRKTPGGIAMSLRRTFAAVALFALATLPAVASAQVITQIRWPEEASRAELVGPPGGGIATVTPGQPATASRFGCTGLYAGLAELLGVSGETLRRADVIAFEANGGSPGESGGWESSRWTFSDGKNSATVTVDAVANTVDPPGAVLANASITSGAYTRFFGLTPVDGQVISFLLIDVPAGIDLDSRSFEASVEGYASGEGTPDPDAIGLFSHGCLCSTGPGRGPRN